MATNIGEVYVAFRGDTADLNADIDRSLDGAEKRVQSRMKSMGKGMMIGGAALSAAVTAPLVGFAKVGIAEMNEVQAANAQTQAAIESTGGAAGATLSDIQNLAAGMQELSGADNAAVQAGANLLLTFTGIKNNSPAKIFDQTSQAALDMASRMSGGVPTAEALASANIQLGKALNDPAKGYTALSRVGVSFTEKQIANIKALEKAGKHEQAQLVILNELNKEFGGSAAAAGDTAAGRWAVASDQLAGVAATLVTNLMPAFESVVGWIQKGSDAFNGLSPGMQKVIAIGLALVAVLGPLLIILGAMVTGAAALVPLFAGIGAAFTFLLGPVGLVIAAVALLALGAFLIYKHWGTIGPFLSNMFSAMGAGIKNALTAVLDFFKNVGSTMVAVASAIGNGIKNGIMGALQGIGDGIVSIMKGAINALIDAANFGIGSLNSGISAANKLPGVDLPTLPEIPRLAHGGLATAPTLAMVGDNPGAALDPEVISPLSKLRDMIGGGGGGGDTYNVEFNETRMTPDQAEAVLRRAMRRANALA